MALAKAQDILTKNDLAVRLGIKKPSRVYAWLDEKQSNAPNLDYALLVSRFLGGSIPYLTGAPTGDLARERIANEVTIELSKEDGDVLRVFGTLTAEQRRELIGYAKALTKNTTPFDADEQKLSTPQRVSAEVDRAHPPRGKRK